MNDCIPGAKSFNLSVFFQMLMSAPHSHTVATVLLAWQPLDARTAVLITLDRLAAHVQLDLIWMLMASHALVSKDLADPSQLTVGNRLE